MRKIFEVSNFVMVVLWLLIPWWEHTSLWKLVKQGCFRSI